MNKIEEGLKRIQNLSHERAYELATAMNGIYHFFTDEDLMREPNRTLEMLATYRKTPRRIMSLRDQYKQKRIELGKAKLEGTGTNEIFEDLRYISEQIKHEAKRLYLPE